MTSTIQSATVTLTQTQSQTITNVSKEVATISEAQSTDTTVNIPKSVQDLPPGLFQGAQFSNCSFNVSF